MRDPRHYIEEIRTNLQKIQAQGQVTPAENALFGMADGLAGLMLVTLERVTELERRIAALDGGPGPGARPQRASEAESQEQPSA
jgi:hypothetical protein